MTGSVEALITNCDAVDGQNVIAGNGITLTASDQTETTALTVSAAMGLAFSGGGAVTADVAVSRSLNTIGTNVRAGIENSDATATTGDILITALSDTTVKADAVGVAIGVSGGGGFNLSLTGAGAEAKNTVNGLTESFISDASDVSAGAGAVTLSATESSSITADVTAVSVSAGMSGGASANISIAVALARNETTNTTRALIDDSKINAGAGIGVTARSPASLDATGAGVSVAFSGAGGLSISGAGAAAVTKNLAGETVEAQINNADAAGGQSVVSGGGVAVSASDAMNITADATAAAVSLSYSGAPWSGSISASIAAAIAENTFSGTTRAGIDKALVDANGGNVTVSADSNSILTATPNAYAVAAAISVGGVSFAVAGSGASATNTSTRTIEAYVRNGSTVEASGAVTIEASDDSDATATVNSIAVAAGMAGVAVGIGLAHNTLTSTTNSCVLGSSVEAEGGAITIDADATQVWGANASVVAVTAAIGAAGAGGDANTTISSDVEAYARNANLTASGDLYIDADSNHTARAKTFGLAGALGFSVSVMSSVASIGGATRAYADGVTTINVGSKAEITADSTAAALPDADSISSAPPGAPRQPPRREVPA